MPASRGLRLLSALLQHQARCQQLSATCLPVSQALQAGLPDASAGAAQAPCGVLRGLTSLSSASACKAAPGCGCRACSAKRVCKAAPGCGCSACSARRQPRVDPAMLAADQSRWRPQPVAAGASTADVAWQHGRRAYAAALYRAYSTAATAPPRHRRQRMSPTVMPGAQHSAAQPAHRSYSTLEECQPEVRKSTFLHIASIETTHAVRCSCVYSHEPSLAAVDTCAANKSSSCSRATLQSLQGAGAK